MRIREPAAAVIALVLVLCPPAAAQRTRDRPIIIFTISGAYLDGVGLWTVADQPITDFTGAQVTDHFRLSRSIRRTWGAGFSGTYFKGRHVGITGDAFLLGLGYDDRCELAAPGQSARNINRCNSVEDLDHAAAAVALTAGLVYRLAPEEFISPFLRASFGILVNNQSPLLMTAETLVEGQRAELTIYDDENRGTRLRPALSVGAGTTIAVGQGYHLRWEVRDNIVGVQRITGATPDWGFIPPSETAYKHLLTLIVGLDVVLERRPGRRY
jgi:hypothetical protein